MDTRLPRSKKEKVIACAGRSCELCTINSLVMKFEEGCLIVKLHYDTEFGNQFSYFSGVKNIDDYSNYGKKGHGALLTYEASIEGAKAEIQDKIEFNGYNKVTREILFSPIGNSQLFDFVSRYVVETKSSKAYIAGKTIHHESSNIYHQYLSNDCLVEVPLCDDKKIVFKENSASIEPYFDNVFYLRDESSDKGVYRWIVHHRKIVKLEESELIVRGCNPRIEGVLPFNKIIPKFMKKPLFRIREKRYPNFPIMAVGVANVSGFILKLKTDIEIVNV